MCVGLPVSFSDVRKDNYGVTPSYLFAPANPLMFGTKFFKMCVHEMPISAPNTHHFINIDTLKVEKSVGNFMKLGKLRNGLTGTLEVIRDFFRIADVDSLLQFVNSLDSYIGILSIKIPFLKTVSDAIELPLTALNLAHKAEKLSSMPNQLKKVSAKAYAEASRRIARYAFTFFAATIIVSVLMLARVISNIYLATFMSFAIFNIKEATRHEELRINWS